MLRADSISSETFLGGEEWAGLECWNIIKVLCNTLNFFLLHFGDVRPHRVRHFCVVFLFEKWSEENLKISQTQHIVVLLSSRPIRVVLDVLWCWASSKDPQSSVCIICNMIVKWEKRILINETSRNEWQRTVAIWGFVLWLFGGRHREMKCFCYGKTGKLF